MSNLSTYSVGAYGFEVSLLLDTPKHAFNYKFPILYNLHSSFSLYFSHNLTSVYQGHLIIVTIWSVENSGTALR